MKLPICWLKDFADIGGASPEDIAAALFKVGFEVEEIIYAGKDINNVVTARIVQCEKHKNSDDLHVCKADIGNGLLEIVCGAPNVKVGITVPCALVGAALPGGVSIKAGEIRGAKSFGMLCSGKELGIDDSVISGAEVDGLLILSEDTPLGIDIKEFLGLDEYILDVSVTANRPDCQSIVGIAREVAASLGVAYRPPVIGYPVIKLGSDYMPTVEIKSDDCTRYTGRLIKDVKVERSPEWMRRRLYLAGLRAINNIVDITNYVLLEIGQPLHAFDVKNIDRGIIVRKATDGEKIIALSGVEYSLSSEMLVIADKSKAVAIAGVMGGQFSGVYTDTSSVFLEAAGFERSGIRRTSRKLGLRSDSSARYEKGVDYLSVDTGRERALTLISDLGAGKIVSASSDAGINRLSERTVTTTAAQISGIIGINIKHADIMRILSNLGFCVTAVGKNIVCTVPLWRDDIEDFADLSEEVIRYYGYDRLKPTFLEGAKCTVGGLPKELERIDEIKAVLCGHGAFEAMSYSFINDNAPGKLMLHKDDTRRNVMRLHNPLGADLAVMRTQLTHNMISMIALNLSRDNDELKLFEVGRVYLPAENEGLPKEKHHLSIGIAGKDVDFYTVKNMVTDVLRLVYQTINDSAALRYSSQPFLHPGKSADVLINGQNIGYFGEVHPTVLENYGIACKIHIADIDLTPLLDADEKTAQYKEISKFPAAVRDLAVLVGENAPAGDMLKTIIKAAGELIEDASVFDVYRGSQVATGKKSIAFSMKFRVPQKTLSESDVTDVMKKIITALNLEYGAEIRQ